MEPTASAARSSFWRSPLLHDDPAGPALVHRLSPERIRHHQAVIAVVEPTGAEVRRVGHEGHAHTTITQLAGAVAPPEGLAPGRPCGPIAGAGEDDASVLFGNPRGYAHAKAHLLLIPEHQFSICRQKVGLPDQEKSPGEGGEGDARDLRADGLSARGLQAVLCRESQPPFLHARRFNEPHVFDAALVAPEVLAVDVAKREPQTGMNMRQASKA